jgi:hypothetical protein
MVFVAVKASKHAWLFCILLFYTALLMWYIFTKLLSVFFPCHTYIAKIFTMNTHCSTENIPVMQVSAFAQVSLPNLESQFASYRIYLNARQGFFPKI